MIEFTRFKVEKHLRDLEEVSDRKIASQCKEELFHKSCTKKMQPPEDNLFLSVKVLNQTGLPLTEMYSLVHL